MSICEMCNKKKSCRRANAMQCDAILCRACIERLRKDGLIVADYGIATTEN